MIRSLYVFSLVIILSVVANACQQTGRQVEDKNQPPNIIFILTDDLGWGDLGVFYQNQRGGAGSSGGPRHFTPNLDQLADEGAQLRHHYAAAPVCAPSRASLLRGVSQGHAEIRDNQFDKALPNNHTIASVLKEAGYATGIVGKYGLQGRNGDSPETWEAYPTNRGFDYFFGYVRHRDGHNHYPAHKARERPKVEVYSGQEEVSDQLRGAYTTDLFTAAAKHWISGQKQEHPDQPFFLFLAYDTPHAGLQVASNPYPEGGGLDGGLQWIGEKGNIINTVDESIDDFIHPDYVDKDWSEPQKRFASMVRRIDSAVGDLRQLLKDLGIDQNTMVVFSSDNGPHRESYGYGAYDPTFFDSFGPLDGIKRDTWEGGLRMPTLAAWPAYVPSGQIIDKPSANYDWLPTFADAAGLPAPASVDGVSLLPSLTGEGTQENGLVYVEYVHGGTTPGYEEFAPNHQKRRRKQMQMIRLGDFAGVRYNIQSAEDDFEIYNVASDPGQRDNLIDNPEQASMIRELQEEMKVRTLQARRPNTSAPRPYDDVSVPAVEGVQVSQGVEWKAYEGVFPWVPKVAGLEPVEAGRVDRPDLSVYDERAKAIRFSEYIRVPDDGPYTFSLSTDTGALLRLHDITVIDADYGYKSGTERQATINLEAGLHPFRLYYINKKQHKPLLDLQWSGPGISKQPVPAQAFFHDEHAG